jgi:hypothetical protein
MMRVLHLMIGVTIGIAGPSLLAHAEPGNGAMSRNDLDQFFQGQQKESIIVLELLNGSTVRGHYSGYDEDAERIWLTVPDDGHFFHQRSIRLSSVHDAHIAEPEPVQQALDSFLKPQNDFLGDDLK